MIEVDFNLINKRLILKSSKNYNEADKIRTYLLDKRITLKDVKDNTEWEISFNN